MEEQLKKSHLIAAVCVLFLKGISAYGQQGDVAFGVSTLIAPAASTVNGNLLPSLTGGAYPVFSGDVIFFKRQLGIGGDVAWKGSRGSFQGFPYRPIFYDFNAVWVAPGAKHITPELAAGIGAESVRFYGNFIICGSFSSSCTNYTSSNHFMAHFGGGLRLYVKGNFFVRPEAHLYLVHNNVEFSSGRATRVGLSIGYTFRPPQ